MTKLTFFFIPSNSKIDILAPLSVVFRIKLARVEPLKYLGLERTWYINKFDIGVGLNVAPSILRSYACCVIFWAQIMSSVMFRFLVGVVAHVLRTVSHETVDQGCLAVVLQANYRHRQGFLF